MQERWGWSRIQGHRLIEAAQVVAMLPIGNIPPNERGKQTFVDVGMALMDIRERRGYRFQHGTFEEYLRERWG